MRILSKYIKQIFKKKVDENNKKIKRLLYTLLVENEEEIHINHFQIHLIQTKTTKDLIAVTVTLGKPGLLIGVSGLRIKHIQNKLTILLYKEVKVEIKEFDVWS